MKITIGLVVFALSSLIQAAPASAASNPDVSACPVGWIKSYPNLPSTFGKSVNISKSYASGPACSTGKNQLLRQAISQVSGAVRAEGKKVYDACTKLAFAGDSVEITFIATNFSVPVVCDTADGVNFFANVIMGEEMSDIACCEYHYPSV